MDNVILLTAMGDYRYKVMTQLMSSVRDTTLLLSGDEPFDVTVKTIKNNELNYVKVKNIYFFNRKFMFQLVSPFRLLSCKCLLVDLNPRIVNLWFILFLRKILGLESIVWGHAWPRNGKKSRSIIIRKLFASLANKIIVYTETQARELQPELPRHIIVAAPNSLFYKKEISYFHGSKRNLILYVGRLVSEKKPILLLEAFLNYIVTRDSSIELCFIGDGPESATLQKILSTHDKGVQERVHFLGHVNDFDVIEKYYKSSFVSVSPGYVGLSITQSFSFGIPMVISDNEPHAPEIEAAQEGVNSLFFSANSSKSLSEKIMEIWDNKLFWTAQGNLIAVNCAESYSVEKMAERIVSAIKYKE